MKTKILSFVLSLSFVLTLFAQDKSLQPTYTNGGVRYSHPMKKSKNVKPKIQTNFQHECISIPHGNVPPDPAEQGYNPRTKTFTEFRNCVSVFKGINFEANNMAGGFNNTRTPADNYLAISNNGRIVSVDNFSIIEFDELGNEISNTEWQYFFPDGTLTYNHFFDPKVIYDSYDDRFILVILYRNQDYSDSRVLVSFSNSINSNALTWNHYDFKANDFFTNTQNNKYWFDYPNIAINKDEFFVTVNVIRRTNGTNFRHKPLILQIDKSEGYNNMFVLPYKEYTELFTGNGNYVYSLLPLSDGLQSNNYQDVMYFVNNYSSGSSDMWWRKLTGNVQGSTIIENHYFNSPVFYNIASYASQKGGNASDRIRIGNNRIRSGFYKDSKLHFVFHSSDSGWMQIVYEIVDVNNNSVVAHTYGGLEDKINYLYPSITCMNQTGSYIDKIIVNYNRTSPNMYIQLNAIDFQQEKWGCWRGIKYGKGILNLRTYDGTPNTYEHLGDYTSIQRKYNSNKSWLVGSYPFGAGPNNNGATNGLNAWVSEVYLYGLLGAEPSTNLVMYPNPNNNSELYFSFSNGDEETQKHIIVKDITGVKVFEEKTKSNSINLLSLKKGIYFVEIITKNNHYENRKLIIN